MKKVDVEAEKKRILETSSKTIVDHTSDIDEAMKVWAKDAWVLPPNGPLIDDYETLKALGKQLTSVKVIDIGDLSKGIKKFEVSESGDLAYKVTRYRIVNEGPEGPVVEKGFDISMYRKIDGEWKLAGYAWNSIE